jgi:sugar-specific transcriptional regulator TrmB
MKPIPSLEALGLTRLEALAYAFLVANPAATGYRVSKGIGKPTANVYRALESLERKGAVRNDGASPPLYRAVAPDELLAQLESEFMDRREIAARALVSLESLPEPDTNSEGVQRLGSRDEVLARTRILLTAARRAVLLDAPAPVLQALALAIADARTRGARVVVLARGSSAPSHPDTLADARDTGTLRVVADGRDALVAGIAVDAIREAIWTRSPLIAHALHDAIANDFFYLLVEQGLREGLSVDDLEGAFERCRAIRALLAATG